VSYEDSVEKKLEEKRMEEDARKNEKELRELLGKDEKK
jgi:hypothetical protein